MIKQRECVPGHKLTQAFELGCMAAVPPTTAGASPPDTPGLRAWLCGYLWTRWSGQVVGKA